MSPSISLRLGLYAVLACATGCGPARTSIRFARYPVDGTQGPTSSAEAYALFLSSELSWALGSRDESFHTLTEAISAEPNVSLLRVRQLDRLLRLDRLPAALEGAKSLVQNSADSLPWLCLAELSIRAGELPAAQRALSEALAHSLESPRDRAEVQRQTAALTDFARAPDTLPPAAQGLWILGPELLPHAHTARERSLEARAHQAWSQVETALYPLLTRGELTPADRLNLLEARLQRGHFQRAQELLAHLPLATDEAGGSTKLQRGALWLASGRAELGLADALAVLELQPDDLNARWLQARCLLAQAQWLPALQSLGAFPPGTVWFAEAQQAASGVLRRLGHKALARELLQTALAKLPATDSDGRDTLLLELAEQQLQDHETPEALHTLEGLQTPTAQHARARLLWNILPTRDFLAALELRSGTPQEDALADAWVAYRCTLEPQACSPAQRHERLQNAQLWAAEAAITLRTLALQDPSDPRNEAWLSAATLAQARPFPTLPNRPQ